MSVPLLGEDELKRIAQLALKHARGDQAQATVSARNIQLTRFANNAIHQNVASREAALQVRVVKGKRVSTIRTSDVGEDGIARAAQSASELADRVPENTTFAGLPPAQPMAPA
ncbi:MAG: PmbA/TldA family metallopeptidase, partial [Candidatus Limnocylindria bacterium]